MSIVMMTDNPAGSQDLHERILDKLGIRVPLGGILPPAGPSATGGRRVVEVRETTSATSERVRGGPGHGGAR